MPHHQMRFKRSDATPNSGKFSLISRDKKISSRQVQALVDSWATRFGALAVLRILRDEQKPDNPIEMVLDLASFVLLCFAIQILRQYVTQSNLAERIAKLESFFRNFQELLEFIIMMLALLVTIAIAFSFGVDLINFLFNSNKTSLLIIFIFAFFLIFHAIFGKNELSGKKRVLWYAMQIAIFFIVTPLLTIVLVDFLSSEMRIVVASLSGVLLLGMGEVIRRFGDRDEGGTAVYPSVISLFGICYLFGALYACDTAIGGLVLVAAVSVALGWKYGPILAFAGLTVATLAPFLVGGDPSNPFLLLGYFILVALVGLRIHFVRRWPGFRVFSFIVLFLAFLKILWETGELDFMVLLASLALIGGAWWYYRDTGRPVVLAALEGDVTILSALTVTAVIMWIAEQGFLSVPVGSHAWMGLIASAWLLSSWANLRNAGICREVESARAGTCRRIRFPQTLRYCVALGGLLTASVQLTMATTFLNPLFGDNHSIFGIPFISSIFPAYALPGAILLAAVWHLSWIHWSLRLPAAACGAALILGYACLSVAHAWRGPVLARAPMGDGEIWTCPVVLLLVVGLVAFIIIALRR